ncbi:unnamed protein product [Chondrus crispus]|uniref:TLC domain-containing protein n=1 Tax=Chondrus crispus TaxID=2769 RepID=R7Q9A4_CHOCR|nr:unnamed protein product [Chondrus crispus]CDF35112.1 unnamed protein product [Chondrus crispus]|eukprot:XP_005714931.1 unnamed protein product [Chondrus crispus]
MPPPLPSSLPPDLVTVVSSLTLFYALDLFHRHYISPLFPSYVSFPPAARFDWDRRSLNLFFQLVQTPFNLYLLLLDPHTQADPLYGYSPLAHLGFLIIVAFYLYDAAGIVMHPTPPSSSPLWLFHHSVAVALLVYDISYRRCSALPAAAFLISAAGHVSNEARWLCTVTDVRDQRLLKPLHLFCVLVPLVTCGLPPPWLLYKCARQLRVSVVQLVAQQMRPYCLFFFIIIYVPHLGLIAYQARRAYRLWGAAPKPFRIKKLD